METKPGIYTTEFWVTLFTVATQFVNLFGLWNYMPNQASAILTAVIGAAYTVSRGLAKGRVPYNGDGRNPVTGKLSKP